MSAFSFDPTTVVQTGKLTEKDAGQNAILKVDGIVIADATSNTVTDAITGLTLNLTKTNLGSPTQLTVSIDTSSLKTKLEAFVKAYNDAVSGIKSMTAYDSANKKASILTGDSTARSIQSQLDTLVQTSVTSIAGGISRLSDIGITVQKNGTLATNSTKLAAALADPDKDVAALFTQTASGNTGIAVRFSETLAALVGASGPISTRTEGINASVKDIGSRREAINLRLVKIEARYRAQFTSLDSLIASMQQTSTYLTQQLASLQNLNK